MSINHFPLINSVLKKPGIPVWIVWSITLILKRETKIFLFILKKAVWQNPQSDTLRWVPLNLLIPFLVPAKCFRKWVGSCGALLSKGLDLSFGI